MSQPTTTPTLTPQFCFNERALRDFLRLSRASIDDTISTQLNALLTPSTTNPFTPSSPHHLQPPPPPPSSRHTVPSPTCTAFKSHILYPTWHARTLVLEYCTDVATSADPNDPTLPDRSLEAEADRARVVDERLDPYSGRFFPREARTERLAGFLRMESGIERIVRARTWGVLRDRCGEDGAEDGGGGGGGSGGAEGTALVVPFAAAMVARRRQEGWEVALDKWRREQQWQREKDKNRVGGMGSRG